MRGASRDEDGDSFGCLLQRGDSWSSGGSVTWFLLVEEDDVSRELRGSFTMVRSVCGRFGHVAGIKMNWMKEVEVEGVRLRKGRKSAQKKNRCHRSAPFAPLSANLVDGYIVSRLSGIVEGKFKYHSYR
ncbi:hypothetical protein LR48_Vigan04g130300 [Vigna angularis]|uniref:Uncharacterized protein n=1 Tax=Phaseolus angularis TaxID=3914 RepID=A0A0L9UDV6_PHAAN|nr:hypothetical protein LR48_Vigan04g130300 [Vigna angularis]